MPLVHRALDVLFRALDAADLVRERLDRFLGRAPPTDGDGTWDPSPGDGGTDAPPADREAHEDSHDDTHDDTPKASREPAGRSAKRRPSAAKAKKSGAQSVAKETPKASRKGSVDRTGAEVDSARARAVWEHLRSANGAVIEEEATVEGRKVLARVVWALDAAEKSGSELGLTAADASALLHLAAGIDVFATNVARACRDETHLIAESTPDGRSKRYILTAEGRRVASSLPTRKL